MVVEDNSDAEVLINMARTALTPHEVPKAVLCLPHFVYTSSGKVKRILPD